MRTVEYKEFDNKLWKLMLPIALQSFMLASVAAGDAIMLGRVEQNAMSAVSLATQIQFIQNMMLAGTTGTIGILGAQYWGKGNKNKLNDIFLIGIKLSLIISVLFFVGCVFFPSILMKFFTNEQVLIEIGCQYLKIAGWSYLLTGISQSYLSLMKITERAVHTSWISSWTVVLNLILNGILIFGLCGMPKLGVRGAAYATLIARIIELILTIIITSKTKIFTPNYKSFFKDEKLLFLDFNKIMLPIIGAGLLWGVGFTSYTAILGHMGTDAAAANSVSAVIRDLACCLCNGIQVAGGILIGNELGSGKLEILKNSGIRLAKLSVLLGIGAMLVVLLTIIPVIKLVILTEEAKKLLIYMMVIMAIYMIGRCINTVVINGIFGAGGDTIFDMYSLVVMMWLVAIPLAFLSAFVFHLSPIIVYACTCLDEVGKLPWVYLHFKKFKWVKDLTRE